MCVWYRWVCLCECVVGCACVVGGWVCVGGRCRAVGAGPAAAGPIFGQLTCAKMLYEPLSVVQLML